MSTHTCISTENAPAAIGKKKYTNLFFLIGPYSQAVAFNNMLFVSGQIGFDKNMQLAVTVDAQAHQALANMKAILEAANSSMDKVVKTTIFLKNMGDFATINDIYKQYFTKNCPARATVEGICVFCYLLIPSCTFAQGCPL